MKVCNISPSSLGKKFAQRLITMCNEHTQRVGKNVFGVKYPSEKDVVTLSMKK